MTVKTTLTCKNIKILTFDVIVSKIIFQNKVTFITITVTKINGAICREDKIRIVTKSARKRNGGFKQIRSKYRNGQKEV